MHYLDNAATTKQMFTSVYADIYNGADWFNSNANYAKDGMDALNDARDRIKRCLGVNGGYVLFTRCATESIEWLCRNIDVNKCWCSPYEHDSVYNACGGKILDMQSSGRYLLQDYVLYCHQLVNQIDGSVWDIRKEYDEWVKYDNQFFGVDITAAIGHVKLPEHMDEYCDAIWWSGHKFNCEKGIGGIWINDRLFNRLRGKKDPSNQYSLIHGTINVASTIAMSYAMNHAVGYIDESINTYDRLIGQFMTSMGDIPYYIHKNRNSTNAINLITLDDINVDALQQYLASKQIYVGLAASACADAHDYRVPIALGLTKEEAEHSIRVSFSRYNNEDDIEALVNGIKEFKELFVK